MAVPTANQSLMHSGGLNFPAAISVGARHVDALFHFIYTLSAITFFGIVIALVVFILKYRRRPGHEVALDQMTHNAVLEILWSVVPLILVGIIFVWGYTAYIKNIVPQSGAKEIRVTARKWSWIFEDPATGFRSNNEVAVPVNQPIRFVMSSEDVIHSLFVPNLRIKQDILPNHYTSLSFTADVPGRYQIFCTEYCGDGHSKMLADLVVLTPSDYAKYQIAQKEEASKSMPLNELGQKISNDQGCFSCHSVDGKKGIGPSWKGIYGQTRAMANGASVKVDDNYIRRSVVEPAADVVAGFAPMMPTYAGKLSDQDMAAIIEYIRTVK